MEAAAGVSSDDGSADSAVDSANPALGPPSSGLSRPGINYFYEVRRGRFQGAEPCTPTHSSHYRLDAVSTSGAGRSIVDRPMEGTEAGPDEGGSLCVSLPQTSLCRGRTVCPDDGGVSKAPPLPSTTSNNAGAAPRHVTRRFECCLNDPHRHRLSQRHFWGQHQIAP